MNEINNEFDRLLETINKEKDAYGGIILSSFKKIKGIMHMSFTKSPLVYLIDTLNEHAIYSYSKN